MFQKKLDQLMLQEMTRKQFLMTIGFALIGLTGLPTFLAILSPKSNHFGEKPTGYGMQDYGP